MHATHVPLVTPFTPEGEVDVASLERLAKHVLDGGASGLVALGTTGEPATLSPDELETVLRVARNVCDAYGAPLTVGAGTMGTDATIAQARERASYADRLLVVAPYYLRPTEEGVVRHFAAVASAVDVPVLIYNIPYRTGRALSAETILRILDLDGVVGMKHCPGGIDADTLVLLAEAGEKVLCGDDAYAYPMLALGAGGVIAATANLVPSAYANLDLAMHDRLVPLVDALFSEPSPTVLKACLAARGIIDDPSVRAPFLPPAPETVERALKSAV
ncbi:4-hydroxy-tetrahydrodipicolinate synthase family protein [Actinomadura rupiterrae]|uniref:4-hydroxy-tetrahydrodipicolinate synthase family protein n=1 Tax=Actinomadura rupiterrae TaxID=559627 RepID=UPI0020A47989|nr:4-hydroxy-tetrahydrodipicolinate synthase [Actinomadura rupiterrae]MCP2343472.1 4-hydroxy-tetrahydrodipicolinate synthase [Actinomadura rupiterrae]